MKIEINSEQVEQLVHDTILKAGIGKAIQEAVVRTISASPYNNPIDEALKRYIVTVVEAMMKTEFREQIDAAVREAIKQRIDAKTLETLSGAAIEKIVRAAEDRY